MQDPGPVLVVPVFNPSPGWEEVLVNRFNEFCKTSGMDFTLVLVNDGSTVDIRSDFLEQKLGDRFRYLSYENNCGKGAALKYGFSAYRSDVNVFSDIDLPYTARSMAAVAESLVRQGGIAAGYRDEVYYADVSVFRTLLSKSLRLLNTLILGLPVNDTQCGLKAFDRKVAETLAQCRTDRFLIDLELLLAVTRKKLPITPVHVELREDVDFSRFNSSVLLKELGNFLILVWHYRLR